MTAVAKHSAIKWNVNNCLRITSCALPFIGIGRVPDAEIMPAKTAAKAKIA